MPNVTAESAAVPKPKSSSSHAPNVTNSAWAAAVSPSMLMTTAHPAGSSRVAGVSGRDVVWCTAGSRSRRACTTPAIATTPTAPTTKLQRHDDTAATSPSRVTPMSNPSAHDVSNRPVTRPRRSYGTWSAVHEMSATSNTTLVRPSTSSPTVNSTIPELAATITLPTAMPRRPPTIAGRRGRRSIEPADERRRQAGQLGDGQRHAEVGEVDVEAAGDRRQERRGEAVDGIGGEAGRGECGHPPTHDRRVRVVEHPGQHRAAR